MLGEVMSHSVFNLWLLFCSPVNKTPSLRSRRSSSTTGRTATFAVTSSSMDDFEDLLDEFTDDRLADELDLDSGKGEDDLLLELSEMIDN